jgi:hypothetical protein
MKVMANVDSHPAETFSQRRLCAAPYGKLASVSSRIRLQRSASSDSSANRAGIISRESNQAMRFHTARVKSDWVEPAAGPAMSALLALQKSSGPFRN